MAAKTLLNFIDGAWVQATATGAQPVTNPATGEHLGDTPLCGSADVDRAVASATKAFASWRRVPMVQRARVLFRYKALLEQHFEELARICTTEHGKTLDEARGSVRRGIENVEHACGIPTLMMGEALEDIAGGIDCATWRQPIGVFAAITPYNFPAMVPLWFWPYAVATGNTFVLKPSEQVPLSQVRLLELATEAGLPPGVLNLVHGGKDAVEAILAHPGIAGVSFVGSSPVARIVYARAGATGKRVQALGGAKNHIIVMPDADLDEAVAVAIESCFGCAGQRCLAGSTVVGVGAAHDQLRTRLVKAARAIKVGDGLDPASKMGPVISARHKERVLSYIEAGTREGADLLVDGRDVKVSGRPQGHWVGPTLFDGVTPEMRIGREEIFGPVMAVSRAGSVEDAIALVRRSEFANATSIFTKSGRAAREFRYGVGVSMIGVNIGVAAPMAFFPFGGTKGSFFGDLKAHGKDAVRFYTDAKVVISRWT